MNFAAIKKSSVAEYFSKNLQQVGFSSSAKAVLTTLKESVDNSLDACEEAGILPEIKISVKKEEAGSGKNTDLISVSVEDNGPGLPVRDLAKVFGEYLVSSKFGQGRCSRGQQGIGVSAATAYAQLTGAKGVQVTTRTASGPSAISALINMDIKNNKGILTKKKAVQWEKRRGLKAEFLIEGKAQLNGEGGLVTYLEGTALVNPHLSLEYRLLDKEAVFIPRVSEEVPTIPPAVPPHPHTMKLGEFLQHAGLHGKIKLKAFLKTGFSRVSDKALSLMEKEGLDKNLFSKTLSAIKEEEYKAVFRALHKIPLANPPSRSVMIVGEEGLSKSVRRLGDVDFFSVVTRTPKICDYKSVVVETALARLKSRPGSGNREGGNLGAGKEEEGPVRLLRFANRVPLQFDKSSCAVTKAAESVNWRNYGLSQPKRSLPLGPYIFAVAVTSPFIKFKNASKETIDAGEELVEEIRLTLMRAGQKLQRHIRKEKREEDLIKKREYIEKFAPVLLKKLSDITGAGPKQMERARQGLNKILSKDAAAAEKSLQDASAKLKQTEGAVAKETVAAEKSQAAAQLKETAAAPASTDAPFQEPPANSETKPKKMTAPSFQQPSTTKKISAKSAALRTGKKTERKTASARGAAADQIKLF